MSTRKRLLIYSHDSFGLGHIRRCRTIAHALTTAYQNLEVLIVSGSPIIGSFEFKARVDFVKVPGLIKLRNGDYESLAKHRSTDATTKLRASVIGETALAFAPDFFLVDKEPLGLRGELLGTLEKLKASGTRLILGIRDILDAPDVLRAEWERKRVYDSLRDLYDDIWIFGLKEIYEPLQGLPLDACVYPKMTYTGYLHRTVPQWGPPDQRPSEGPATPLLVTTGGGGDGAQLVSSVLGAYAAHGPDLPEATIVLGPFMPMEEREMFLHQANALKKLRLLTFDPRLESRLAEAQGVVAMGGYNTFCEILSFDRRAVILPRVEPRQEQLIRAQHASRLGLCRYLAPPPGTSPASPDHVAEAILNLSTQAPPSKAQVPGLLDGVKRVVQHFSAWMGPPDRMP